MRTIYFNGIPVNDGYAGYLDQYFSPKERRERDREEDIEDVEYEDLTEN